MSIQGVETEYLLWAAQRMIHTHVTHTSAGAIGYVQNACQLHSSPPVHSRCNYTSANEPMVSWPNRLVYISVHLRL